MSNILEQRAPTAEDLHRLMDSFCDGAVSRYYFSRDHASRLRALEDILEHAYDQLIRNRQHTSSMNEDQLSSWIVAFLEGFKINASHDTQVGGHVDILVRGVDRFLWIGEAKIHGGYDWLEKGFNQLATRYSTGSYGQDQGEVIIYLKGKDAVSVLREWQARLLKMEIGASLVDDKIDDFLWFRTQHVHVGSGRPFTTRHRIIPLHFAPVA